MDAEAAGGRLVTDLTIDESIAAITFDAGDDDLDHIYACCNSDLALCGADLSDVPFADDDGPNWEDTPDTCVVCLDLEAQGHCPMRGSCGTEYAP